MAETRRKFDADFKEGAVPTGPGDGQAGRAGGRDLGINKGTLGNWGVPRTRGGRLR